MTGPPQDRRSGPPTKRATGAPAKRPPGPPGKRPGASPGKRPAGPPGKRPPAAPGKQPPEAGSKRASRKAPAAKPARSRSKMAGPNIVFAIAFVVILLASVRAILIGPPPRPSEIEWFPLSPFFMGVVASFVIWPIVAFWGSRRRNAIAVWGGTGVFIAVSLLFWYPQHLVFGGVFMLAGAVWYASRN